MAPAWQPFEVPVQGSVSLLSVTAAGRDDAWAGGLLVNPRNPPRPETTADDENCDFAKGMFTSVMLRWDGRGWQQVTVPNVARINQVSASNPEDAWASADCGLLHWNGESWTPVPFAPIPGAEQTSAGPITAVGPKDAWLAAGTYDSGTQAERGFVQHWNGRRWRTVPLPDLGDDFQLDGIDAGGPRDVWAAGTAFTTDDGDPQHLLLLHWNGRKWVSAKVPDERGELMDVAVSGRQALAAGDTLTPSEPVDQLRDRYRALGDAVPPAMGEEIERRLDEAGTMLAAAASER